MLDLSDALVKTLSIIRQKPYATVKVQLTPQRDRSGKVNKELITFTIINDSFGEIDVQKVWFLTSFNRQISSKTIDSKMPIRVLEDGRATYFVPIDELKAALNKSVGETINKAVVFDKNGRQHVGRVDKAVQGEFTEPRCSG